MYNFNSKGYTYIPIKNFSCGSTQNLECKIGKKNYYLDIHKTSGGTWVELYRKTTKNRDDQSKYDANSELHAVFVQNDAFIDREFLENIKEIERAVNVVQNWKSVLK